MKVIPECKTPNNILTINTKQYKMSEEQNAIQKLYADPKAKGFVNHIIGAYLPINKIEKVWVFKSSQKHKCNICGQKLFDIQTVFENMQKNDEKLRAEFHESIMKQINGEEVKLEEHPMYKYVTQGAVQAFTGQKTDTCLCNNCIRDLLEMVQTGLLMDDKNIVWLINRMRRTEVFDVFKNSEKLSTDDKKEVERIEKKVERSEEKKITTFGDLEVLQKLKAKMEEEENGKE
jgi:hypothetical protein